MIFTQIDSSVDSTRKTLALFNKDWNTYKTNWQNTDGIKNKIGSIFASSNTNTSIISNKEIQILRNWNNAVKHGCTDQETYNRIIADANDNSKMYFIGLNKGKGSLEGLKNAQKVTTASTIGLTIEQTALNIAISFGIAALTSLIVKGYDKLANSVENCKKRVDDLMSSYESALNTANNNANRVEELADKYEKLSKGVNNLGENVSLTNEEYKEYNSLVNEIANMFPNLIQGWTDEGTAIIDLKGNVEGLRDAYKEAQQEAYNLLILSGNDIMERWKDLHDTGFWADLFDFGADDVGGGISVSDALEQLKAIQNMTAEEYNKIQRIVSYGTREEIVGLSDIEKDIGYGSYLYKALGLDDEVTDEIFRDAQIKARALIQTYNAEMELGLSQVKLLANSFLMGNEDYNKIENPQLKTAISKLVNSINEDVTKDFDNPIDVASYVDNIVQSISSNNEAKKALIKLFTIDTSDMSINEIEEQVDSSIDIIAKALNKDPIELKTRLNPTPDIKPSVNKVQGFLQDEYDDKVYELTLNELQIAANLDINPEETKKDIESELKSLEKGGSVNLTLRPQIDTAELNQKGWDAGKGIATVFSSTFSNEDETVAINFTPIIADPKTGEYLGVLSPDELQEYAEGVIAGTREDDLNLQIGGKFEGENAIEEASNTAKRIHELHGMYFVDGDVLLSWDELKAKMIEADKTTKNLLKKSFSKKTWNDILNLDESDETNKALKEAKSQLEELAEQGKLTVETFQETPGYESILEHFGFDETEISKMISLINSLVEPTKQLSVLQSHISNIGSNYSKKKENGSISASDLTSTYDQLGVEEWLEPNIAVWEKYKEVATSSTATIKDLKKASDDLVTALVKEGNYLANVTEETKEQYIALLKDMGVKNAEDVVNHELIVSEKNLAIQKEFVTLKSKDLADATAEEIDEFIKEMGYSDSAANALYQLALKKQLVNDTTLNFDSDFEAIADLVEKLNGASSSLRQLAYLKKNGGHLPGSVEDIVNQNAQEEVDDVWDNPVKIDPVKFDDVSKNTGDSSKEAEKSVKDFREQIDWTVQSIEVLTDRLDNLNEKLSNTKGWNDQIKILKKIRKALKELENGYKKQEKVYDAQYKKQLKQIKNKKLRDAVTKKIESGKEFSIEDFIDKNVKSDNTGVREALYNKINEAIEWYNKRETAKDNKIKIGFDIQENLEKQLQLKIDYKNEELEVTDGLKKRKKILNQICNLEVKQLKNQLKQTKNEKDKLLIEKQILRTQQEKNKAIIDEITADYDKKTDKNQAKQQQVNSYIDLMAAQNYSESSSLYNKLISLETSNQKTLEKNKADLEKKLVKGDLSAEDYHEVYMELMDINDKIVQCQTNQAEWNNKIREIEIQRFDETLDAIKQIADESSSLVDILSFEDLFKDKGEITDAGFATLGLYAGNYNVFAETLSEYADEYKRWKKAWEEDPTKENYENMVKYQDLMQESTKSMLDNKEAIYNLVKEGYDLQIEAMEELVNKEKELLDKEKDRYEWERNIGDKNKNINVLKAQIAELALSDDRADIAQRLKLEQQLAEATRDRDDTLYEHDIDLKKEEWDKSLEDFKDGIEKYLSDKDFVISNVIDALNDPENIAKVKAGLQNLTDETGIIISDNILAIWENDQPVKAYGDTVKNVLTGSTGVTSSIKKVNTAFNNMYKNADDKASAFRIYKPEQFTEDKNSIDSIETALQNVLNLIDNISSKNQNVIDTMKSVGLTVGNELSIVDDLSKTAASVGSAVNTTGFVGNMASTVANASANLAGGIASAIASATQTSQTPENDMISKKKATLIAELKSYGVSDNKIEKMRDELKPSKMYNTDTSKGSPKYTSDLISLLKKYDVNEDRIKQIKNATFSTGGILSGGRYKLLGEDGLFLGKNGESVMTQEFTKLLPSAIDTMDKFVKIDYLKPIHNIQANTAPPQVTFDAPLFYVQGNTDENVLKEVRTMMKNEVPEIIGRAWKTTGRRI